MWMAGLHILVAGLVLSFQGPTKVKRPGRPPNGGVGAFQVSGRFDSDEAFKPATPPGHPRGES